MNSRKNSTRPQSGKVTLSSTLNLSSFNFVNVKPRLFEDGFAENKTFLNISEGFKRLFSADKKDRNMVIPISGYLGHRRGDSA